MNGDPLSFQIWTNQQIRFSDIEYHMNIWKYPKKFTGQCLFLFICGSYFSPTSLNKDTIPNALLVKKFASLYIQPVANNDNNCTLMMLENLAKPEWISVSCTEKILTDVVCVKENEVNGDTFTGFDQIKTDLEVTLTIFQCGNGKTISSMRQCNGLIDFSNGEDENRCLCFVREKLISDSHFCRYHCKKPECSCSELFLQSHTTGCFQYKPLATASNEKTEKNKIKQEILFTCPNETMTLDNKLVNDLIPDCKSNADENILYLILTGDNKHNVTQISTNDNPKEQRYCFEGHPKLYHVSKECVYEVDQKGILQT